MMKRCAMPGAAMPQTLHAYEGSDRVIISSNERELS